MAFMKQFLFRLKCFTFLLCILECSLRQQGKALSANDFKLLVQHNVFPKPQSCQRKAL